MPENKTLPSGYPVARRSKQRLTAGWRFHLGDVGAAEQANFDDAGWEIVNIPHTLKMYLGATTV